MGVTADTATENEELTAVVQKQQGELCLTAKATRDKMKLFLELSHAKPATAKNDDSTKQAEPLPPVQRSVDRAQILKLLEPIPEIVLQLDVIDDLVQRFNAGAESKPRRISKGTLPVEGRDGRLLLLVKHYENPRKEQQLDYVDPRCFRNFDNIEKGNVVARIYPPRPGKDGIDALGKVVKCKEGKPAKFKVDGTITIMPPVEGSEFQTAIANIAGFLTEEKGALTIRNELIINEVNFETGDIDFVGSVKIKGDVLTDFKVIARNNIEIGGNALHSQLWSRTGTVVVKGTVFGYQGRTVVGDTLTSAGIATLTSTADVPQIRAAGSVSALLLEDASVEAGGDIVIEREAKGCLLRTKALLQMPKAALIGGTVHCVCGVEARTIGSQLGVGTRIVLCSDVESTAEFSALQSRVEQHQQAEELLALQLGSYAENPNALKKLPVAARKRMEQLVIKLRDIQESRYKLEQQEDDVRKRAIENIMFRVNYLDKIFAGTTITVGDYIFNVDADLVGPGTVEFLPDERRFVVSELKPIVCTVKSEKPTAAAEVRPGPDSVGAKPENVKASQG